MSRRGPDSQKRVIKYIFREEKLTQRSYSKVVATISALKQDNKAVYVAGIKLTKENVRQLISESKDAKLLAELKKFDGTVKEFIDQRLVDKSTRIPNELQPIAREARQYKNAKEFSQDLLYHGTGKEIENFRTRGFNMLWASETPALAQVYIPEASKTVKDLERPETQIKEDSEKGTMYVMAGFSKLKIFDATHDFMKSNKTDEAELNYYKGKLKQGYDGIKMSDTIETEDGKFNHYSIGLFPRAFDKLNTFPVKAERIEVEKYIENRVSEFNPKTFYKRAIEEPVPFIIKHNLRGDKIDEYIKEFQDNEKQRIHTSSRQVDMNHTIISYSNVDAAKVTDSMLQDMANEYIRLRGENNIYLGTVHREKDHVHLHLAMSATRLDGISSRIPKDVFQEIKIKLQEYQKEKYPELSNSLPKHRQTNSRKIDNSPEKNAKRNERSLDKNFLIELLETTYSKSTSSEHFLEQIKAAGHEPYFRNGKLQGIKFEGNQKFRFTNLGFSKEKIQELDTIKEKNELQEIQTLRNGQKNRLKDLSKAEQSLMQVIVEDVTKGMTDDEERNRNQEILNQNREFERNNGIQTDSNSSRPTEFEKNPVMKAVYNNLSDNFKKDNDEPKYYTTDTGREQNNGLAVSANSEELKRSSYSRIIDSKDFDNNTHDTDDTSKDDNKDEKEIGDIQAKGDSKDDRETGLKSNSERDDDDLER